jgi:hypothetical protein
MTKYYFIPPTEEYGPAGGGRLFIRYRLERGISVMRTAGVWAEYRFPTEDETRAADPGFVFLGGRKHYLNDVQRTELINAGYGSRIYSE